MLSLILLFLFFFVVWPLLKLGWRIWQHTRMMNRFMADPDGEMRRQAGFNNEEHYAGHHQHRRRSKKIPRDVGEYVAFKEIEISEEELHKRESQTPPHVKVEDQVSDTKWVDIK